MNSTHTLTVLDAPAFRRYSPIDKYAFGRGFPANAYQYDT